MYGNHPFRGRRFARAGFWGDGWLQQRMGGRHGRHGRGGGRARMFDQGDLRLVILGLLSETPRHGYDIIKLIGERMGGAYSPSPGVVYPNLTMLEDTGYATTSSEGTKTLYTITAEGSRFLADNKSQADAIFTRMEQVAAEQAEPAPQILRAMENLRAALRLRVRGGRIGEDEARRIADVLDGAAKSIEQI